MREPVLVTKEQTVANQELELRRWAQPTRTASRQGLRREISEGWRAEAGSGPAQERHAADGASCRNKCRPFASHACSAPMRPMRSGLLVTATQSA